MSSSVRARLERSGHTVPSVRLAPCRCEGSDGSPVLRGTADQYELFEEIGRGGIGVVLRGRDVDLGRDVALKLLREEHGARQGIVRRFVAEARIGGQLEHPGIVPVYDLGLVDDRRPYFAMKLVEGVTLETLLDLRDDPTCDRQKILSLFERVCQTVAYAHARGVVHRDLKPANVMVGSFGEVQVVDWGLAKVLHGDGGEGGGDDEASPAVDAVPGLSRAGEVMGTFAYMPPEQARGAVEHIDARTDVFALGAILCEILTGAPAYRGETDALPAQAREARLDDARGRLDACVGDGPLVALCRRCLDPDAERRPRDAAEVASCVGAHLADVATRAHRARLEAVEQRARSDRARQESETAKARARADGKRRRQTLALGAAAVLLLLVLGGGWAWLAKSREDRARSASASVALVMEDASRLAGARQREAAGAAARRAVQMAERLGADGETQQRARDLVVRLERERAEAARREELIRAIETRRAGFAGAWGVSAPWAHEERLADLDAAVLDVLVPALDEWAVEGREEKILLTRFRPLDPDPVRERIRNARGVEDLLRLADESETSRLPARTLDLLATRLGAGGETARERSVLRAAHRMHPDDVWLLLHLAEALEADEDHAGEAPGFYEAAAFSRPTSLAITRRWIRSLRARGAEARSTDAAVLLARALMTEGRWDEVPDAYGLAEPPLPATEQILLAKAWRRLGDEGRARAALAEALTAEGASSSEAARRRAEVEALLSE